MAEVVFKNCHTIEELAEAVLWCAEKHYEVLRVIRIEDEAAANKYGYTLYYEMLYLDESVGK